MTKYTSVIQDWSHIVHLALSLSLSIVVVEAFFWWRNTVTVCLCFLLAAYYWCPNSFNVCLCFLPTTEINTHYSFFLCFAKGKKITLYTKKF